MTKWQIIRDDNYINWKYKVYVNGVYQASCTTYWGARLYVWRRKGHAWDQGARFIVYECESK